MLKYFAVLLVAAAVSSTQLESFYGQWIPVAGYLNQQSEACMKVGLSNADEGTCTCADGKDATVLKFITESINGNIEQTLTYPVSVVEPADVVTAANVTCNCNGKTLQRIVVATLDADYSLITFHETSGLENPISPFYVYIISKKVPSDSDLINFIKNSEFLKGKQVAEMCNESIAKRFE